MELAQTTQERIFLAADVLYAESDNKTFPTVDAVRKHAKVNMNDASTGMKAWRKARTQTAVEPIVQIPPTLQQASANALASLWSEASRLATETLRAAEAGWETERKETEALREQMADAFERQAEELESLKSVVLQFQQQIELDKLEKADLQGQCNLAVEERTVAEMSAQQLATRVIDIQQRADDLRIELNHVHCAIENANKEIANLRLKRQEESEASQHELASHKAEAEAHLTTLHRELALAREEAAELRGQVEGMRLKLPRKSKPSPPKDGGQASDSLFPSSK